MLKNKNGLHLKSPVDIVFDLPNFEAIRHERRNRNNKVLKNLGSVSLNDSEKYYNAAIVIQKTFRGYLGRKRYFDLLYELVKEGEEKLNRQEVEQVAEGEILIESYRMQQELLDTDDVIKNRKRLKNKSATLIQRVWRQYHRKKKEHLCCSCQEDYPDIYEYYKETQEICFCCDYHKLHGLEKPEYTVIDTDNDSTLPYPTTDWLHVESLLSDNNNNTHDSDLSNSIDISDIKSRLTVDQDVKLTFVESYESANDIEITYDNVEVSDIIENVTDNKSPDHLEPVEASQRVLKSLKIHEEHEQSQRNKSNSIKFNDLILRNKAQLVQLVSDLESSISKKNLELVSELTTRDELNSQHEALLMEADDLVQSKSGKR